MMRSLYSGISGLRNHQTRMDVIGNNIANVNTTGYKASRVIFQDVFSQTLSGGMANIGPVGGTNPMQIGLGIRLSSVDVLHNFAPFQRTDKETDMMINGEGFFMVRNEDNTGYYYTRAGNFYVDNEGYLVTGQGLYVAGYSSALIPYVVRPPIAGVGDDPEEPGYVAAQPPILGFRPATAEDLLLFPDIMTNLPGTETFGEGLARIRLTGFRPDFSDFAAMYPEDAEDWPEWDVATQGPIEDATPEEIAEHYREWLTTLVMDDVFPMEEFPLVGFAVGDDGSVSVMVNNRKVVISQVAVAMFANPAGLDKAGNSLYRETASSGRAEAGTAYYNGAGSISGGGLEMSNVDLASEFTDMIVTQRGFQANSRIITVSDTMLEELVNLKR